MTPIVSLRPERSEPLTMSPTETLRTRVAVNAAEFDSAASFIASLGYPLLAESLRETAQRNRDVIQQIVEAA